ncbi:MAG: phosphopantothenoylcysteine decarboxylase [Planctomycetaceae bacterium]|nr:phosphopantothenoylcysteine decarboxylase [Planctomycetaceae bacterium]
MRILITAGPTREYLDDVRYLSNASSGRMGYAIADAALQAGHEVVLVTGPVALEPPAGCEVHHIETTDDLLNSCVKLFPSCDGVIAVAAVCDYRPVERVRGKITKTGTAVTFEFIETADVLAELGKHKENRWIVGFALESQDPRENAMRKLKMKNCDCIVLNDTSAIAADANDVEVLNPNAETVAQFRGAKPEVAVKLFRWIESQIAPL